MNKPLPLMSPNSLRVDPPPTGHLDLRRIAKDATPAIVELWRALMYRKWFILGLAAAVTLLTLFLTLQMQPIYRSSALMLFEGGSKRR